MCEVFIEGYVTFTNKETGKTITYSGKEMFDFINEFAEALDDMENETFLNNIEQ